MAASLTLISLGFTFWTLNIGYFTVLATADGDFDYDALPGTQHEFKVQVNAGKEECFAQKVALGAVFHVQYEVLRGGDRAIDVVVIDPDIKVTEHDASKTEGHITFKATKEGKLYTQ